MKKGKLKGYGVYTMLKISYNEYKRELVRAFDNIEDAYNYIEDNPYLFVSPIREG